MFNSIIFWRIRRQVINFYVFAMILKPLPNIFVFMIRCIILNIKNMLIMILSGNLFQKIQISFSVKNFVTMIIKFCTFYINTSKNFNRLSLSGYWYCWTIATLRPSGMYCRILSKRCFIFKYYC